MSAISGVSQDELDDLAGMLGETFIQRWDLFGRQLEDGSYILVKEPLQLKHLCAHLRGEITLSAYVLDGESRGRYMVLDADDEPDGRRLKGLALTLEEYGGITYLEASRRGAHLWFFFAQPLSGREIRRFGHGLLAFFDFDDIELFPKQDRLRTGPGSAIRLPFGFHRKSGRRYGFYTTSGEPLASTLRRQIRVLARPATIPAPLFERFSALAPAPPPERAEITRPQNFIPREELPADAPLYEQVKGVMPVRQFVQRYVSLSTRGKGICPFHDDQIPSFHINDEHNFWYCFACEEGGSVIDFWMKWRRIDFGQALAELAEELLS